MSNEGSLRNLLIVLSAPSGCGKTTIAGRLLARNPDWTRSISMTTRPMREGEQNGVDYWYVSEEEFEQKKKDGEFLECAQVFSHWYGTPKDLIEDTLGQGRDVLLTIDVQGVRLVKKLWQNQDNLYTIFILPPSLKVLEERLRARKTDSEEQIALRLKVAQDEIKEASEYQATVINKDLDTVVSEIESLIKKQKK